MTSDESFFDSSYGRTILHLHHGLSRCAANAWNLTFPAPRSALRRNLRLLLARNVSGHREVPEVASQVRVIFLNRRFHYVISSRGKNDRRSSQKKSRGTSAVHKRDDNYPLTRRLVYLAFTSDSLARNGFLEKRRTNRHWTLDPGISGSRVSPREVEKSFLDFSDSRGSSRNFSSRICESPTYSVANTTSYGDGE